MNSSSTVSAEVGLRLVASPQTIVPLTGSLFYSRQDPYAVRIAFHVGLEEPVEWIFARDLLSRGIKGRQGIGDVQVRPSPGPAGGEPGSVPWPVRWPWPPEVAMTLMTSRAKARRAPENRACVRELLWKREPAFAAELATAEQCFPCPALSRGTPCRLSSPARQAI